MKKIRVVAIASAVALGGLISGCANTPSKLSNEKVSVTTFASAQSEFFPKRRSVGMGQTKVRNTDEIETVTYPLMAVRSCNSTRTACSVGVVKLAGTTELKGVDAGGATVAISLTYDLGRKQTMSDGFTTVTNEIPEDVTSILQGHRVFSKQAYLPFGEMRKVSFDHGVDFVVCVNHADEHNMPTDARCETGGIQDGTVSHDGLQVF
ncbi:hypothetical protein GO290_02793 [Ralstonia solanacearum]|nr:hypothetical protein [Ralstonia solanacearum]